MRRNPDNAACVNLEIVAAERVFAHEPSSKTKPGLTPYGLRHTVAVILRESGEDERTIADAQDRLIRDKPFADGLLMAAGAFILAGAPEEIRTPDP